MQKYQILNLARARRRLRVRTKISGTAARPRLSVSRSLHHISAQLIDDVAGRTLVGVHDREVAATGTKTERAALVGKLLAEKATSQKITVAVFDKGRYKFHGRIKALAEAAREAGLTI